MINAIITGHNNFSKGLLSSVEMIAGEQKGIKSIPFTDSMSLISFADEITTSITELRDGFSPLIIFTDIIGGTPFTTSMLVSSDIQDVHVISGTNIPMLLEFIVQRGLESDIECVLNRLIHSGKKGVLVGEFVEKNNVNPTKGI